jgi:hypothetical protein
MMKMFSSVSGIVGFLAKEQGWSAALSVDRLRRRWAEVVGPQIAAHTDPEEIRYGTLRLRVDSPIWNSQLSYFKMELIEKSNDFLQQKLIHDLRSHVAPLPIRHVVPASTGKQAEIPEAVRSRCDPFLTTITDPALKEVILHAMARHLPPHLKSC